ncbi:hypothetical protein L7F22_015129 [Adiantum nelumboides]|nr:hypothetical protein [Adiantum nelumboides]
MPQWKSSEEVIEHVGMIQMYNIHPWMPQWKSSEEVIEHVDFEMSDAQKEHVHEVEHASPRLAALRIELCPDYMSEGRFWKIYFVLLHSRLSKKDAVLLSTPQIMEARALLLSNLQKKGFQGSTRKDDRQGASQGRHQTSGETMGDTLEEVQNKNVLASTVKLATLNYLDEEADADRWLHEESSPHLGSSATAGLANEDDVSFSDLEEDDDSLISKGVGTSNVKGTQGWVELNEDHEEQEFKPGNGKLDREKTALAGKMQDQRESSDWLTVEEDDSDFS